MSTPKNPIINCHTHVFIGESIPPKIAKTFIPWPFYNLLTIKFILGLCRFWYTNGKWSPNLWKYQEWHRNLRLGYYKYRVLLRRSVWGRILFLNILNFVITYHGILYLMDFITASKKGTSSILVSKAFFRWLSEHYLYWDAAPDMLKMGIILFTFIFVATGRKIIFFIAKQAWSFLKFLPDQQTIKFVIRYINIGRFAYYKSSDHSFDRLQRQYPSGTGFVLLPMDMEFMGAGKIDAKGNFRSQMDELAEIKEKNPDTAYPFVFVDPRRKMVGKQPFLKWKGDGAGGVLLEPCFIQEFIEERKFNGFKIYPALGYYPFDEALLPLWKYAADKGVPITTHCIRGTIFYRGSKKADWDYHPVFKDCYENEVRKPMLLSDLDNVDFINNFTHPLNYLCLVEERLLRLLVEKTSLEVQQLFGFTDKDTPLRYNLSHLKLCFGHYGGDDEWKKYFDMDRDIPGSRLVTFPEKGINLMVGPDIPAAASEGLLMNTWKSVDWYSIISSMLIQYDNLYADISYIVHNEEIFPLLKSTLRNPALRKKVLFGTDFFVVRNYKSEKEMVSDSLAGLSEEEFDAIARDNPIRFL
jgi:predicted TIM-barrel fold metal-dependent hydrolase